MPRFAMSASPRCRLTPKDFRFLKDLLEKETHSGDASFLRLLRHKLSTAIVMFPGDFDHRIATIDSRVGFTANAGVPQSRILVGGDGGGDKAAAAGRTLPVTTPWGLALLGLAVGETVAVMDPAGPTVRLRLERVEQLSPAPAGGGQPRDSGATILDFSRRAAPAREAAAWDPIDPDDDPGPSAA